jgi:hypothetical protein
MDISVDLIHGFKALVIKARTDENADQGDGPFTDQGARVTFCSLSTTAALLV